MFLILHEEEKQEETRKARVNGPRPWVAPNDWCAPELGSGLRGLGILWTVVPWRSPLPHLQLRARASPGRLCHDAGLAP